MLGPQFDQPPLPGLEKGAEQMALFRTKELSDGTMRGSYNTSPYAKDWVESAAREKVKPGDIGWAPPRGNMQYGDVHDPEQLTEAAAARFQPGGDLEGEAPHLAANLVDGGRAHLARLRGEPDDHLSFMEDFSAGTDFGDTRLKAKPYDFRELEIKDSPYGYGAGGQYSSFTPEGEQVAGMEYEDSTYLNNAQVITGAGSNRPFKGRGFGTMTAAHMAVGRNHDGVVVHGNSFTEAGSGAFEKKGAASEATIDDRLTYEMENNPDVVEEATQGYSTEDLADMAGYTGYDDYAYDEDNDTVFGSGTVHDRDTVARMAVSDHYSPVRDEAAYRAKEFVEGDMLYEQQKTLDPIRPMLGVPDRSTSRRPVDAPMFRDKGGGDMIYDKYADETSDQKASGYWGEPKVPEAPNSERLNRRYSTSGKPVPPAEPGDASRAGLEFLNRSGELL